MARLKEIGINDSPGSIARLFLHLVNESMSEFYETLSVYHANSFLSTAEGVYLDAIGTMLNCIRQAKEEDEAYRYRLSQHTLSLATANETAIRLACLSVEGVEDVQLRAHYLGTGSFAVVVLNQENISEVVLAQLKEAVAKVAGFGIRYEVIVPIKRRISLTLKLLLKDTVTDGLAQDIRLQVNEVIRTYISSRPLGQGFIINELTQLILNASPYIANYIHQSFQIDEQTVFWANQTCEWNEKFAIALTSGAIKVL